MGSFLAMPFEDISARVDGEIGALLLPDILSSWQPAKKTVTPTATTIGLSIRITPFKILTAPQLGAILILLAIALLNPYQRQGGIVNMVNKPLT